MKLAHQLVVLAVLMVMAVAGGAGVFWVHRDQALLEREVHQELAVVASELRPSVIDTLKTEGRDAVIDRVDSRGAHAERLDGVTVHWVELEAPAGSLQALEAGLDVRSQLAAGFPSTETTADNGGRYTLWLPVQLDGRTVGALQLIRDIEPERAFVAQTARGVAMAAVALSLALAAVVLVIGRKGERVLVRTLGELDKEHAARLAAFEKLRHADRLATAARLGEGIAHELGTPLTVVTGRAKMIANLSGPADPVKDHARIIGEQAARMAKLVRQLLDFSRDQPGPRVPTDLCALTQQSVKMLAPMAEKKGVHVELELGDGEGQTVAVETQVGQALTNLLVNGLQATPSGGHLVVTVHKEHAAPPPGAEAREGDFVRLSVSDDGPGIEPENLAHIFDPFFTTRPFGEGTGLGLTVAYGIARDHGGWIDVRSEKGKGSTFALHLPAASASSLAPA
ncbi:MAG: HAMP domain-containing sensor histidine kinase [Myxococcaceae bacterium]